MSVFRAFIAVNLTPDVLDRISQVVMELRDEIGGDFIRWIPVENMHLTLKFLGDVSISNLERIKEVIQTAASSHPVFAVSTGGVGAFPSVQRARVVWAGVEGPPTMTSLQRMIDMETARLGYASENRAYKPHLTLGRVSRNVTAKNLRKIPQVLKDNRVGFLGVSQIREIHLFRSDLTPTGAVYSQIYTASLAEKK